MVHSFCGCRFTHWKLWCFELLFLLRAPCTNYQHEKHIKNWTFSAFHTSLFHGLNFDMWFECTISSSICLLYMWISICVKTTCKNTSLLIHWHDACRSVGSTDDDLCSDKMLELSAYLKHAVIKTVWFGKKQTHIANFIYVAPSSVKKKDLTKDARQAKGHKKCFFITLLLCVVRFFSLHSYDLLKRHEKKKTQVR